LDYIKKENSVSSEIFVDEQKIKIKNQWVKQYKSGYTIEGGFIKTNILFKE
jgi:hypothetical protein